MLPRWLLLLIVAVANSDRHNSSSVYSISSEFGMDTAETNCEDEWYLCELKSAGWYTAHDLQLTGPCTIERRSASTLSVTEFISEYVRTKPVIITGGSDQSEFKYHSTRARLLEKYSNEEIILSTANTYSYTRVRMSVQEYINQYMFPQTLGTRANKTLYYFGDNDREGWKELFNIYKFPFYEIPNLKPEISFGMAGPSSGVAFHFHGPTFAETIYGRKRWFLYSPQVQPNFDPNNTTLHWLHHVYPSLPDDVKPFECTLLPGEVLFIPDRWWHATINVDTCVFVSTFLGPA
ncbi:jmjC domain-containing protein 8-like isoform X1 [Dysidea avara]|uniref:jmjC domain-containing protein 8-like isoform X1 n=1 Tax=Dysidea avara TaxID=196820 RepID=UPI0033307402